MRCAEANNASAGSTRTNIWATKSATPVPVGVTPARRRLSRGVNRGLAASSSGRSQSCPRHRLELTCIHFPHPPNHRRSAFVGTMTRLCLERSEPNLSFFLAIPQPGLYCFLCIFPLFTHHFFLFGSSRLGSFFSSMLDDHPPVHLRRGHKIFFFFVDTLFIFSSFHIFRLHSLRGSQSVPLTDLH